LPFPIFLFCPHPPGKAEFDEAMTRYWVGHKRGRVPGCITIGGNFIDPWAFWREVWAWGGPDQINEHRVREMTCCFYGSLFWT
jgi:hypothetical protein